MVYGKMICVICFKLFGFCGLFARYFANILPSCTMQKPVQKLMLANVFAKFVLLCFHL